MTIMMQTKLTRVTTLELRPGRLLPSPCWAICTSATRSYASSALKIASVPVPDVFVTAEDVAQGKP